MRETQCDVANELGASLHLLCVDVVDRVIDEELARDRQACVCTIHECSIMMMLMMHMMMMAS